MREIIAELLKRHAAGAAVAYCRLVETRGSTPQKAGAAMLVFADGSQAGTLGGGCVEADVKRRALATLDHGTPEIVPFVLDNDYGWDDGLICGGRMQVLVEPLSDTSDVTYFERLAEHFVAGSGCTEAVVFDDAASGLVTPASYLFDASGQFISTLHGNVDEASLDRLVAGLPALVARPRPSAQHGIAYLPNLARCRLIIVGGGHVGQAVADLAAAVEFDVTVVDDRAEYVSRERFPRADRLVHGKIEEALEGLAVDDRTYCLIVTRGHAHDEQALYRLVDRGAAYVGMIGSRRKIKLIFDDLEAAGIARQSLDRVFAPVGLDIGSQIVMEIAVSIVAELVAHRNLGASFQPARLASEGRRE